MTVAADCPICDGTGILVLGRGAMEKHGPEVASLAVEVALETRSRADLGQQHPDLTEARRNQSRTVAKMRQVGLLARADTYGQQQGLRKLKAMTIAQVKAAAAVVAPEFHPEAMGYLSRPVLEWTSDDRPLASGGIPGFSAGGFVAHLVRVADPQDPLTLEGTRLRAQKRTAAARRAEALAGTLPLFDI